MEQLLMRNLMRACASARRHPHGQGPHHGAGHRHGPRGFGHILALLSETSGISQQQIAEQLGIRPQSVSEAIGVLERQGLIRKESDPADRRVTLIHITQQGRKHGAEMEQERRARAEKLFSVLSAEEKETLLTLLQKINAEKEQE